MQILPGEKRDLVENGARFQSKSVKVQENSRDLLDRGFAVTVNYTTGERPVSRPKRSNFGVEKSKMLPTDKRSRFPQMDSVRTADCSFDAKGRAIFLNWKCPV